LRIARLLLALFQSHVGQAQIGDQLLEPLILLTQLLDFLAVRFRSMSRKCFLPASMKSF